MSRLRFAFVRALPRKAVSRAIGVLSSTSLPRALLVPAIAAYARGYRVDLSEADRAIGAYPTFGDFFGRALRPGARPIDPDPRAIVSPVDGRVHAAGRVEGGQVVPVKGVPFSLRDLLGSAEAAAALEGGTFAVLYLAPRDYHRIHWPFDAAVEAVRHLPGDLWPVDPVAVDVVPRLFARNERVAAQGTAGGGPFALVAVGALNVGSIRLSFCGVRTNRNVPAAPRTQVFAPPLRVRRGDEVGRFALGSAVVLACSRGCGRLDEVERGAVVRMGVRIGALA